MGALATLASEVRGSRNSSGDLTCRFPRVCPNTLFACVSPAASCGDSHEHHVAAVCSAVDLLRRSAQTLNPLWDGFADCTEERWPIGADIFFRPVACCSYARLIAVQREAP